MRFRKALLLGSVLILLAITLILFPKTMSTCTQIDFSKPVYLTTSQFNTQKMQSNLMDWGETQLDFESVRVQGPFPSLRVFIDGEIVDLYVAQIEDGNTQHETIQIFHSKLLGYWLNVGDCGYRVCSGGEVLNDFFGGF